MTKKKLLSLLLVAPVILTGACNTDSSSSSSSDSSSSDSSSTTPVIEENITNWQKDGHLSVQLGTTTSDGAYLMAFNLIPYTTSSITSTSSTYDGTNVYLVNYNSALTAAYSKSGDDIFQYTGDDANFGLRLYPGQAYASDDSYLDVDIVRDNYDSLDNIYNLFNWGVFGLFDLGIDTDSFPDYYKNGGIVYGDLADSALEDTEYSTEEVEQPVQDTDEDGNPVYETETVEVTTGTLNNPEKYQREIAVSLLGGTDGYFTDTNPSLENDDILGYSEFTIGGSDSDGSSSNITSIISTVLGLLGSDDLDIDWTQLDLPGIINLLFSFGIIPDFNFDIADYPTAGYIGNILNILLNGLTASFETEIEDEEGNLHQTLTLGLNDKGLGLLTDFLADAFLDDLLGDAGASVDIDDLGLSLDFVNGGSTWEFGGVSLDLDFTLNVTLYQYYSVNAPFTLSLDLAFDPGETELEDTYFTDLGNLYEGYEAYIADNAAGDSEDSENPDENGDDEEIAGE